MKNPPGQGRDSPWIAPVFLPHLGCPHRCVFCNQHLVSRTAFPPTPGEVRSRLDLFFQARKRPEGRTRQVAFFGGSFTGMELRRQREYLGVAREYLAQGRIDSIRVSARPDELGKEHLLFLREQGVATVEIGVQSLSDRVLEASRRGCSAAHAIEAIQTVRESGLEVGAQIMVGLPGDSGKECAETVETLSDLRPDFVRIYPLLVLRGTELARRYRQGLYRPLDLQEAVSSCARLLERFERASIPVIRIGLQNEETLEWEGGGVLAGPLHPAFGFLVRSFLYRQRLLRCLPEERSSGSAGICFRIHPKDRPLFSGHRRETIRVLRERAGTEEIAVEEDGRLPRGGMECIERS
jgi:histone acetyltransferase (RNA polymerase elongator complex component)